MSWRRTKNKGNFIIIIVNFYSIYILKKFKLRGATNKIIWLVIRGDRQKLSLEHGTADNLWGEAISNKYVFLNNIYIYIFKFIQNIVLRTLLTTINTIQTGTFSYNIQRLKGTHLKSMTFCQFTPDP